VSHLWDSGTGGTGGTADKEGEMSMNYQLEKYHGRASRHECPNCHDPHSFTYYVDENNQPLDTTCGRCDHESSCGYHYTPSEYFQDHPDEQQSKAFVPKMPFQPKPPKPLCTIPFKYVLRSASYNSLFIKFLCGLFDRDTLESPTIKRLGELYAIGATNDMDIIFWQIDINGKVRTGKIMKYGEDGHRIKDGYGVNWVHAKMKKDGLLPDDWELTQCLFGEHLLNWSMNKNKTVALVESEKTALIGAACYPQYLWLATGGKSQMSDEKMKVLSGRTVILFPDVDGYNEWTEKAKTLTFCKTIVSDALEKNASHEQHAAKIDIADVLIDELKNGFVPPKPEEEYKWLFCMTPKSDMERVIEEHPFIRLLIDELGLVEDG
jgi:hypothetical protein